jgi:predicted N-acyltransferase
MTTYSAHYIADPRFRAAIADYLTRERREVERDQLALAGVLPFRQRRAANSE